MVKIVGIGANVHDTLITVSSFPKEDTKVGAEKIVVSGGGPCGTGLVAAHRLGENSAFIGNLADDTAGVFLKEDMEKRGMSCDFIDIKKGFSSFSSYVFLNRETSSRTCVFHRGNVPPLTLSENQKRAIEDAEILMVDGNELDAAIEGAMIAKEAGTKVLYDAGGLYDGIEKLLPLVDILIPSEEFALRFTGEENTESAAKKLYEMYCPEVVCITCGKKGGIILVGGGNGNCDSAYKTVVGIMKMINVTSFAPLVKSHSTDTIPALNDQNAMESLLNLAEYLNI